MILFKKVLALICFTVFITLCSCKNETPKSPVAPLQKDKVAVTIDTKNTHDFLKDYRIEKLPLKDSTNFDNYTNPKKLTESQVNALHLTSIIKDGSNFSVKYILDISPNFNTIIVSYQKGEAEIFTTLLTYDLNYQFIDKLEIAYDEIAESLLRKESELTKDRITVSTIDYSNEEPEIEKKSYAIDATGKIKLIQY